MTSFGDEFRHAVAALDAAGARYALVGGLAVSVRAEPRFTRDADFAVAVDDDAGAEQLTSALRDHGYVVDALVEHQSAKRLSTVRLIGAGGAELDLLFASSGIERELVGAADRLEILPGLVVGVALTAHLAALKVLSDSTERPQDRADLLLLVRAFSNDDWSVADRACALIEQRGFNRGRDLRAALRALRPGNET